MQYPARGGGAELRRLLKKYDRSGPRYTSYPTALSFSPEIGDAEYESRLKRHRSDSGNLWSLYIHIPFCQRRCAYCGCFVVPTRRHGVGASYVQNLQKEMQRIAERVDLTHVDSLHLGGGTPTYLSAEELERLFSHVRNAFGLSQAREISVEIDPRVTGRDHLEALRAAGANRVSLGVQDASTEVQEAIGREQTWEQTRACFALCRAVGFDDINIDLVYGLPEQTTARFQQTLSAVAELRPQRIAVFGYAHVPAVRANQRTIDPEALPSPEERLEEFLLANALLTTHGYDHIGLDHYALAGDELAVAQRRGRLGRNFMGYTPCRDAAVLGLGVSSIGSFEDGYFQNEKKLSRYYARLRAGETPVERGRLLSWDDRIRRYVIQEILCNLKIDHNRFYERFGISFCDYFIAEQKSLEGLEADGIVERSACELSVTSTGRLFLRNVGMVFDAYLGADTNQRPVYSRTV